MDLRYLDMMEMAKTIVDYSLELKPEEEVLMITDARYAEGKGCAALQQAMMSVISSLENESSIIFVKPLEGDRKTFPPAVIEAMKKADVVVSMITEGITHNPASREAMAAGTRLLYFPCPNDMGPEDNIIFGMMPRSKKEIEEVGGLTQRVYELYKNAKEIRVTTKAGTDITMGFGPMVTGASMGKTKPGTATYMPVGQVAGGVIPGTGEGIVVVDGGISPLGRKLREPITFKIESGRITDIYGSKEAEEYAELMKSVGDDGVYVLAEIGFGMNPKGTYFAGNPLGDERYYGSAHIGIGSNVLFGGDNWADGWHQDAVFKDATTYFDGVKVMEDGEFLI